jgi:hypothetical protein
MAFASVDIMNGIVRGRTTETLGYNAMRDRRPKNIHYNHCSSSPESPAIVITKAARRVAFPGSVYSKLLRNLQVSLKRRNSLMSSTTGREGLSSPEMQAQPRLQRNALNLFETISATLANLAPAEGIFLSIGLTVAFMGSRAPWAFLIAMVAVLTLGNTMAEFSRVRPSAGSFVSYIGNGLHGYSPKFALFLSTTCFVLLTISYPIAISGFVGWENSGDHHFLLMSPEVLSQFPTSLYCCMPV